jgi:hypothetical protein
MAILLNGSLSKNKSIENIRRREDSIKASGIKISILSPRRYKLD